MSHIGVICPNAPGHLNPMVALADAIRARGHRVTFLLFGNPPSVVTKAGFDVVHLGGIHCNPQDYNDDIAHLGTLQGRAALNFTFAMSQKWAKIGLQYGSDVIRNASVNALLIDQASSSAGTNAEELGLPFATICNAMLLHSEPGTPPFFTGWKPRDTWWARIRNRVAWGIMTRLYNPILNMVQEHRQSLGLPIRKTFADSWSTKLQISQQPEAFEFPRKELPPNFWFVGPLRLPGGYQHVDFPWDKLDGRPFIFASLGTIQNRIVEPFRVIAEAVARTDVQLVLSTGGGVTTEQLGQLPGNPVVVPYAPQWELFQKAAMVITHAGLNTALDALSAGLPIVAIPIANEQPGIAARIDYVGAGEVVPIKKLTVETLHQAIRKVHSDLKYRDNSEKVRESIRAGGGAPRAAELIEEALLK